MRLLVLALTCLLVAEIAGAQYTPPNFLETFACPDGTIPPDWTWTGDPQGGGQFAAQGGEFVHTGGGYAYYVRLVPQGWYCGPGWYDFDVKDSNWEFAWGICCGPVSGWCCRLYHNDAWGQPGYTLAYCTWSTLPGFPDGQYMYHNCVDLQVWHYWTAPLVGWHHITIEDFLGDVRIYADGYPHLLFRKPSMNMGGYVGLGATAGAGTLTPAFDNVSYGQYLDPVESRTWGSGKALFR